MSDLKNFIYEISSENSEFAQYQNDLLELIDDETQKLQEENKLLRECVELLEKIQVDEINPDRVIYDEIEILLTKIKGDESEA